MRIDQLVMSGEALDLVSHMMLLVGTDGSILDANASALEAYGYSHAEMLSLTLGDVRAPRVDDASDARLSEAVGRGALFETVHRRSDGTLFPVEVHSGPVVVRGEAARLAFIRDVSEARQAADELRESEWRLASILEATRVGTWQWNVQTGDTVYNERWAQILGYTLEELAPVGIETLASFAHPDDLRRSDKQLARHFAGELPYYDVDLRMKHKDGHWVWVHDRGRVVTRTDDGRPLMMFGTHTDITERKRTEDSLLAAETRARAIIDASPVPMALTDAQARITSLNAAFVRTFGYAQKDIPTLAAWRTLAYPDADYRDWVVEMWEAGLAQAKVTGNAVSPMELTVRCGDGTDKTVLASAGSFSDASGGTGLLVLYDISERKEAEAALRDSEERYRSILNASPDNITITDMEGRVLVVSPAALTMYGCEREDELLGHFAGEFMAPEDRERAAANIALMLQDRPTGPNEYHGLRPDGSTFDVEVNAKFIRDAEGRPTSIVFVVRDITERKAAEQRHHRDLEEVANADRLTGLHNLRGLDLIAEQAIAQAQRTNQGVGLIFCDVDDLKTINDEFGHAQGDRALQDAASILKFTLRSADAIARVGGDEFIVLAVGTDSEAVANLRERLQAGFDFFNATNTRPYELSLSSGVAWCAPGAPCRLADLSAAADSDMYAEKVKRDRKR